MNESVDNFIIGFGKLMGVANKAEISEILSGDKEVTADMNDIQKTIASLCKLIKTLSKTSVKITDNICNNTKDENSENINRGRQGLPGRQGIQGERGLQGIQGERGLQGIQGIQGERGLQGIQGERGLQGIQGERGLPGENGKIEYLDNNSYFDLENNTISSNYLIGLNSTNLNSYMFEWDDKNVKNEDRYGRIVYLTPTGTIKLIDQLDQESEKKIPIGVIGSSQLLCNSYPNEWCHKYLKDDFGRYIEKKKFIWKNKKGKIVESTRKPAKDIIYEEKLCKIINPKYNINEKYYNRNQRSEWANVIINGYAQTIIKPLDELDDRWLIINMINEIENIRTVLIR